MSSPNAFNIPGYELVRELGVGGMATVHLAIQTSLDRKVALKVMRRNIDESEKFERRFLVEGRTLAKLPHRNIVSVYDIVKSEAATYISMEYLEGGTLHEKMRSGLSLAEAVAIVVQIAGALQFAHDHGVIHRDLKPANIMFRDALTPVLTDFGIAKQQDSAQTRLTQTGMLVGTPTYMSPEQINALEVDGRSDLYSLGVMFYELLTGHPPFRGETPIAVLMAHLTHAPPPLPSEFVDFQPILDRLLAKSRDDRFGSMKEFVKALKSVVVHNDRLWSTLQADPNQSSSEQLRALGFSVSASTAAEVLAPVVQARKALPTPVTRVASAPTTSPSRDGATRISPAHAPPTTARPWRAIGLVLAGVTAVGLVLGLWRLVKPGEEIDPRIRGEVDARLTMVDRYIGESRLTPPPIGDNALDLLQAVQDRAPDYSGTRQRRAALVAALKSEAEQHLARAEFVDAESALGFATSLDPDDRAIDALRERVGSERVRAAQHEEIQRLLVAASAADSAGRAVGGQDSAYALLARARQMDPQLAAPNQAIDDLLARLLLPARQALQSGDLDAAQVQLDAYSASIGSESVWRELSEQIALRRAHAEKARQVAELRQSAERAIAGDRIDQPVGDNAIEWLAALRRVDPSGDDSRVISEAIAEALVAEARQLQRAANASAAMQRIDLALQVAPEFPAARTVRAEVAGKLSADQRRVAELLAQARQALAERRLFSPKDDNVSQAIDQVLAIDPANRDALTMQSGLADASVEAVRAALDAGQIDAATQLVQEAGAAFPGDAELRALAQELVTARKRAEVEQERRSALDRIMSAAAQPLAKSRFEAALRELSELLERNPRDVDALSARQRLLESLQQASDRAVDMGNLAQTEQLAVLYRARFPESAAALMAAIASSRERLELEARQRAEANSGDLILTALPWGEVETVVNSSRVAQSLPSDRATPMRLRLPAGVYQVRFRHPEGHTSSAQATVRAGQQSQVSARFSALDAKEYARRAGL